jgi:carbamoyltransferase
MKDRVNQIKRRQMFRPFAPAVLAEHAGEHFAFPLRVESAPYMQYVVMVNKPETLPAISHFDNTARVQTVGDEAPILRQILEEWYKRTGCPILLNTSLNIKGEPLVNTWEDAKRWEEKYDVKVF